MAKLTFNIPDKNLSEVIEALAHSYHYPETISEADESGQLQDVPNPQSKQSFIKKAIAKGLKNRVKQAKAEIAAEAAAKTAMDDADKNIVITG